MKINKKSSRNFRLHLSSGYSFFGSTKFKGIGD